MSRLVCVVNQSVTNLTLSWPVLRLQMDADFVVKQHPLATSTAVTQSLRVVRLFSCVEADLFSLAFFGPPLDGKVICALFL